MNMLRKSLVWAALSVVGVSATNTAEAGPVSFALYVGSSNQGGNFGYGGGYGRGGCNSGFGYGSGYGGFGRSFPVYHEPSFHYDLIPHRDHFHAVPHVVPGHFDRFHRGHIHGNPYFHHHHD